MTDRSYKERNSGPTSALKMLFLHLSFAFKLSQNTSRENRNARPPLFLQREHRGLKLWFPYVCSRGPSPCSRLCICTCTSPACCSRWRSRRSGSDLRSTHPRLKHNRNITGCSQWEQNASDATSLYQRVIASHPFPSSKAQSLRHADCQWQHCSDDPFIFLRAQSLPDVFGKKK